MKDVAMLTYRRFRDSQFPAWAIVAWSMWLAVSMWCAFATDSAADSKEPKFDVLPLRGRVGFASEALAKQFQIKEVPEAGERVLVLKDLDGKLHPLVEDIRGRAFRRDKRFRETDVELLVRKYADSPFIQIIQVFELTREGKFELDYWCEICSIATFELKECECCQGPIELRRRLVSGPPVGKALPSRPSNEKK